MHTFILAGCVFGSYKMKEFAGATCVDAWYEAHRLDCNNEFIRRSVQYGLVAIEFSSDAPTDVLLHLKVQRSDGAEYFRITALGSPSDSSSSDPESDVESGTMEERTTRRQLCYFTHCARPETILRQLGKERDAQLLRLWAQLGFIDPRNPGQRALCSANCRCTEKLALNRVRAKPSLDKLCKRLLRHALLVDSHIGQTRLCRFFCPHARCRHQHTVRRHYFWKWSPDVFNAYHYRPRGLLYLQRRLARACDPRGLIPRAQLP